jgi:hypothetical protein
VIDGTVDPQFLRTLLASNAIWAAVTLVLTGIGGVIALVWRRRVQKTQAMADAALCRHCKNCCEPLDGLTTPRKFVTKHVVSSELCTTCALGAHNKGRTQP